MAAIRVCCYPGLGKEGRNGNPSTQLAEGGGRGRPKPRELDEDYAEAKTEYLEAKQELKDLQQRLEVEEEDRPETGVDMAQARALFRATRKMARAAEGMQQLTRMKVAAEEAALALGAGNWVKVKEEPVTE